MTNPVLVEITRGPLIESVHRGAIAVSDAKGRLRMAIGDVHRAIFPRSALKPIQAAMGGAGCAVAVLWTIDSSDQSGDAAAS